MCRLLIPKIIFKINTFWNKRTTPKENVCQKKHFFQWPFEEFINRRNGGYEMIWKLSYENYVHVSNKNFIVLKISPNRWPFSV